MVTSTLYPQLLCLILSVNEWLLVPYTVSHGVPYTIGQCVETCNLYGGALCGYLYLILSVIEWLCVPYSFSHLVQNILSVKILVTCTLYYRAL